MIFTMEWGVQLKMKSQDTLPNVLKDPKYSVLRAGGDPDDTNLV